MMSKKSNKMSKYRNRITSEPNNTLYSWNKNDNACIPLKIKNPSNKNCTSLKKIKLSAFPILEDTKQQKSQNNSFKLIAHNLKENYLLIPKIKKNDTEQAKINNLLPKISKNCPHLSCKQVQRQSFSYFKDKNISKNNNNTINNTNSKINNNNNKYKLKNTYEKKLIKNYFALSQAGKNSDGITKTNQDSYLALTKINNFSNFSVFAVFDGHGPHGHLVSQFLVKYFTNFFKNNPQIKKCHKEMEIYNLLIHSNYKILRNSITLSEEKLKEQKDINLEQSGSTCCIIIQINQKIICLNIGDSRAILLTEVIREDILNLSTDHKPDLKKELERIKKYGGVVQKKIYEGGISDGPFRVWTNSKLESPGLALSRSIGDTDATKLGVLAEPEFILKTIKSNMKFVVIASDGVWELLSNKNVCDIIKPFYISGDVKGGAEELIKVSGEKWAEEGNSADDITAIIIFF